MTLAAERARSGREPFIVAELHLPRCQRTFGSGLCNGTGEPCWKTFGTCKATPNTAFQPADYVYKFCTTRVPVPIAIEGAIPCIAGMEMTPARIGAAGSIGQRGVVTVMFNDLTHNDVGFDPHVTSRAYNPMERGTLFGKLRARNPYYNGRKLVVKIGYLTEAGEYLAENFRTFTYFIESFDGPDKDGKFKITAKDLLKQLDDKRAQCPAPNVGKLKFAITDVATTATLSPTGIGADYPASGEVALGGSEVCTFTRTGDGLAITRAQRNTKAESHEADEAVQLCKVYTAQTAQNIIYDLLVNFANIPAAYIPKAEWDAEQADYLPRLYNAVIANPTSVKTLVNELLEQTATLLWWDEEAALLRFKSIRALSDDKVTGLGEWSEVLRNSLDIQDDPNARLTQVWVYYGMKDPTQSVDEKNNYALRHVAPDTDAQGPNMYGDKRVKEIFSRWIDAGGASAAIDLGDKLLSRFRRTPRSAVFTLDEKDGELKPGDFVQVSSYRLQKPDGTSEPINIQILARKFKKLSTHTEYIGAEFFYLEPQIGPSGQVERLITIAADTVNLNLRALHDSQYADLHAGDVVRFKFLSGVHIGSLSRGLFAVDTGLWPSGVDVYLDFQGNNVIGGMGGKGLHAVPHTPTVPDPLHYTLTLPEDGGPALAIRTPVRLVSTGTNYISGGGGGGGGLVGDNYVNIYGSGWCQFYWVNGGGGGAAHARNCPRAAPGDSYLWDGKTNTDHTLHYVAGTTYYSSIPAYPGSVGTTELNVANVNSYGSGAFWFGGTLSYFANYHSQGGMGQNAKVIDSPVPGTYTAMYPLTGSGNFTTASGQHFPDGSANIQGIASGARGYSIRGTGYIVSETGGPIVRNGPQTA